MPEEDMLESIAGALSAQNFVLENIYALILAQNPDPIEACRNTGAEIMRQFEDLPATGAEPIDPEVAWRITQHGVHRLERFWAGVEARLRSARRG